MASELVVADATGNERPYVDAQDPMVTADEGSTATMSGTISDPDGDPVTLAASLGTVLVDVGQLLALDGRTTDHGSDDLATTWSFGDGSADDVAV
jgi:hypothetical protein